MCIRDRIIPFMVSGFGIFLCRQFAESIPNDILEAARIDGAGEWRIFFGDVYKRQHISSHLLIIQSLH